MRLNSTRRTLSAIACLSAAMLLLAGCPADNGSTANNNDNVDPGGAGQRPVPDACFGAELGGGATPTGQVVFPTQGADVESGDVTFLFRGSDPDGDAVAITVFVSDQPNVFDVFSIAELACGTGADVEQSTQIELPGPGNFFWGIEISDGAATVRRPASGVGVPFSTVPPSTERSGIEGAALLCPIEALPARSVTTFEWSLGQFEAVRSQVFVGRAGAASPFDNPLRVFEVNPPTATSLALPASEALPIGNTLTWGLRVEGADGVAFTLGGAAGQSFVPQANVPPSGSLLSPENGAVLADGADTFVLSWDADSGNCEDTLTSTLFIAPIGEGGVPVDLFNSPRQLALPAETLESNIIDSLDAADLPGGVWGWGVRASDGTDQATLTDIDDATRNFRTFIRDRSPRFVNAPAIGDADCGLGLSDALLFSFTDDNGLAGVSATVSYSPRQGTLFTNPAESIEFDAVAVDGQLTIRLSDPVGTGCPSFAHGAGFYGVELLDGVNGPVRATVEYAGPSGACCNTDGSCTDGLATACVEGTYQGDRTECATVDCPLPVGACCNADGSCSEGVETDCAGTYQGDGSTCGEAECPQPIGACCLGNGACTEVPEAACDGTYQGDATSCVDISCPQPPPPPPPPPTTGACCDVDGFCADNVPADECNGEFDRFTPGGECELLDPPCTAILGACCAQGECVGNMGRGLCEEEFGGSWFVGEECAQKGGFECPIRCAWDNGQARIGQEGREASPPAFPLRRVVDDVTFFEPCTIDALHVEVAEDAGWIVGPTATVFLYPAIQGEPGGNPIAEVTGPFSRIALGEDYFGRDLYRYEIENLGIDIGTSDRFFIGFSNEQGSGEGTNHWMNSDGGIDGEDSFSSFFSDDGGATWLLDEFLQRAFTIEGD